MKIPRQKSLLPVVLLVATVLRLWRIPSLTEFLGDQGRAGIVALDAARSGIIPLSGPTTLTNQHLGPFFYYFATVGFALSDFNPVGPAVMQAVTGVITVLMVFLTIKTILNGRIALIVSALYAVSPQIVTSDRILWEPNLVPIFAFIWLLSLVRLYRDENVWWWIVTGGSLGILFQLHYFNLLFMVFTGAAFVFKIFQDVKKRGLFEFPIGIFYSIATFLIVLSPFILFEISNGWKDIREIIHLLLDHSEKAGKREILYYGLEYIGRMVGYLIPYGTSLQKGIAFISAAGIIVWIKRTWWGAFVFLWVLLGGLAMGAFRGVVHDHYIYFLLPSISVLIAIILRYLEHYLPPLFIWLIVGIVLGFQLLQTNLNMAGHNDIARTEQLSKKMIEYSRNEKFAFTLVGSRSFSDLHYRFFLKKVFAKVVPIKSEAYKTLFIVCDSDNCKESFSEQKNLIPVLCYDPHCSGDYGSIDLHKWQLVGKYNSPYGAINQFSRIELR